jgi:hypothetical protein
MKLPDHVHCPEGCEKPQPITIEGIVYCGRCLIKFGDLVKAVPCTDDICEIDDEPSRSDGTGGAEG